jgi:predicted TIM-barrel fold metal-dependent hydrolase
MPEIILDPELPIIDPHHHLWDLAHLRPMAATIGHPIDGLIEHAAVYLFDQLRADTASGHNIIATVFMECGAFYRADGPEAMKPVGEVEFVNGVAAQSASGLYGDLRACAAIVGHADLAAGDAVAAVLEAEVAAGNGRFRGIRHIAAYDADPGILGALARAPDHVMDSDGFRAGFAHLGRLGLSFDAWIVEPQIDELTGLARAFPQTSIILDHVGTPLNIGRYAGKLTERFEPWRTAIRELATCPNVSVKLGGLGMPYCNLRDGSSQRLADLWRPYVDTCITAFGANRCMFESNFPVDGWACDYPTLWNAFKRLAAGASADEKAALFSQTAARVYGL